ncbi:MAG: nicotinate (nicotinamide) nucleotide adenylyltransferase [Bacteroidales bacterium]
MKTALFFGSFNPIHIGHVAIAGYMLEFTNVDELWFVVSPQNPLKEKSELADNKHRLQMVRLAAASHPEKIKVCDVEMEMPRPSYTIDTLKHLNRIYPNREFSVIMGADSLASIEKWKDYNELLKHEILVYPRVGYNLEKLTSYYNVSAIKAPIIEISSTFIRNMIKQGKDASFFLLDEVYSYIVMNNIY